MFKKNARELKVYLQAGATACLCKAVLEKTLDDLSEVISAADQDSLFRAIRKIDRIISRAEDNMFHDYPNLPHEYFDVFYGSIRERESLSVVNDEVILSARKTVEELFAGADAESNKEKELVEA